MRVYRYTIKPHSAFATPMRSDTLYGQLLCAAAELDGNGGVERLIRQFSDKQPPFVLSSVFPAGKLPLPVLPGIKRSQFKKLANGKMFETLSQHKTFRKRTTVSVADWLAVSGQLSSLKLFQYYRDKTAGVTGGEITSSRTMHNSIDRNSNRVLEGGLYSEEATYFKPGFSYDLYVKTADRSSFERLFDHIATTGFGADASSGKGQFDFCVDEGFDDAIFRHQGNAKMSLSVCMAEETRQFSGTWTLFTKLGKVWNGFGETNPFKKPFIAFTEGSVFTAMPDSSYVLSNIHSNPDYVQIGLPLLLPLTLEEGT
jgi:CRISPR-associated protein Csm4